MTSYFYTAKIAPLGRPFRMPGDEGVPMLLDASSFAHERRRPWHTPVCLDHNIVKRVGCLHDLRAGKEWWLAEFLLDPALTSVLEVGHPVSVSISTMRASGNHYLSELSLVRRGAVAGAEIVSRRAISPAPAAARRTEPAGEVSFGRGEIIRRRNIGRVLAVDGRPVGRSAKLQRALDAPDDGYCTTYDHHGNVLERIRYR